MHTLSLPQGQDKELQIQKITVLLETTFMATKLLDSQSNHLKRIWYKMNQKRLI